MSYFLLTVILFSGLVVTACKQGAISEKPPIHINPNMDSQNRYDDQAKSRFFADGKVNRLPVAGTVATSEGVENPIFYYGKDENGKFVDVGPLPITQELMLRGKDRFNIYCAPCHGHVGDARGIIVNRGFLPPPTFHSKKIRAYPDGRIFDVITNGFRNMPSYRHQIPEKDRWAIVSYVRALQRSQRAGATDVPAEIVAGLGSK